MTYDSIISSVVSSLFTAGVGLAIFIFLIQHPEFRSYVFFPRRTRHSTAEKPIGHWLRDVTHVLPEGLLQGDVYKLYQNYIDNVAKSTSWMRPWLLTREEAFLQDVGLDGVIYLRTFTFSIEALVPACLTGILILFLNLHGKKSIEHTEGFQDIDLLTMAHIESNHSSLWAHSICTLLNTWAFLCILHRNTRTVWEMQRIERGLGARCDRRAVAQRNTMCEPISSLDALRDIESRTILVTQVPQDQSVEQLFQELYPDTLSEVTKVCDPTEINKVAKEEDTLVAQIEYCLWLDKTRGERPRHRTGMLGLWGPAVDSIDFYASKLHAVHRTLDEIRGGYLGHVEGFAEASTHRLFPFPLDLPEGLPLPQGFPLPPGIPSMPSIPSLKQHLTLNALKKPIMAAGRLPATLLKSGRRIYRPAAFATFTTARQAAVASQTRHSHESFALQTELAPRVSDIYWPNLGRLSAVEMRTREQVVSVAILAMAVWFMVPITFISSLTTLDNLKRLLPWLNSVMGPTSESVVQGLLPGLALILFMALLPQLCMWLSKQEGLYTRSSLERAQASKMTKFLVLNAFVGNIVSSTVFTVIRDLLKTPEEALQLFAVSLPTASLVFVNYVALRAAGQPLLELSRVGPALLFWLRTRFLAHSPLQQAKCWEPRQIEYGVQIPTNQLVLMIGVVFSTVAPMVTFFTFGYFLVQLLVARFQLLFMHEPVYESNGSFWLPFRQNSIQMLYIYQVVVIVSLSLKECSNAAGVLGLGPITTYAYSLFVQNSFPDESLAPPALLELKAQQEARHPPEPPVPAPSNPCAEEHAPDQSAAGSGSASTQSRLSTQGGTAAREPASDAAVSPHCQAVRLAGSETRAIVQNPMVNPMASHTGHALDAYHAFAGDAERATTPATAEGGADARAAVEDGLRSMKRRLGIGSVCEPGRKPSGSAAQFAASTAAEEPGLATEGNPATRAGVQEGLRRMRRRLGIGSVSGPDRQPDEAPTQVPAEDQAGPADSTAAGGESAASSEHVEDTDSGRRESSTSNGGPGSNDVGSPPAARHVGKGTVFWPPSLTAAKQTFDPLTINPLSAVPSTWPTLADQL